MKRINSIYRIFVLFLIIIVGSFLILYWYSSANLKVSLQRVAKIQMEYSFDQLDQKVKEIELEASAVLASEDMKLLQVAIVDQEDIYSYVMKVKTMQQIFQEKQKTNSGMAEFALYWPKTQKMVSSSSIYGSTGIKEKKVLNNLKDGKWIISENEIYFCKKYETKWAEDDDEPYLIIRMERDWLYRIKNMASGFDGGGTLCLYDDKQSLFPVNSESAQIQGKMKELDNEPGMQELSIENGRYQVVTSDIAKNGLTLVTYYPLSKMLLPVNNITYITGAVLSVALLLGALYLLMYNRNILMQLNMLTYKLKRVEDGDWTTQITELPDNEFYYVFDQFNHMIVRMNELFDETLKEQELRMQAELEQLQLQINPHFLYNSLSYIVTVAEQPDAVRSMAVHLSRYYRYCTQKKMITTIKEEVSYAKSYLEIMAMRKRIRYTIEMPKEIGELPIIPLILEPLFENAIEHGLEGCESAKQIEIDWTKNGAVSFAISDDGEGMTKEQVSALKERISRKERKEEESVGLWNVNQRLINYYSKSAALGFKRSRWGGLTVYFMIRPEKKKEEESDASIDCR
ncbi:MAG: histidine kinase [Clostridiales bacterium]|nr:histidine kinase [Clostridiales bacterium]